MPLADRIEKRIREIPAHNPGYIACMPETLANILSASLIRHVALEAAAETTDGKMKEWAAMPITRDDWCPIETAPKDGTLILACALRDSTPVVKTTWWRGPKDGKSYIGWGEFNMQFWPPTHWMPIPELPFGRK